MDLPLFMHLTPRAFYSLFAIIIIEGYVVLSSELLAIRLTIPFVGSGTDTVSIIIAAVLLPLSFGYYFGGQFKPYKTRHGHVVGVREKLTRNIFISTILLVFGLSYLPLLLFLGTLIDQGLTNRLILTAIYSGIFLVTPVFLLGQTIPLISNYFSREKLSEITGRILFFSTIGSFLGATFSTLILMATVGVHYTAALNFILLAGLFFTLGKRNSELAKGSMIALVLLGLVFNSAKVMEMLNVVENNQYNMIRVFDDPASDMRILSLNNNSDSGYSKNGKKHDYIEFIETNFIDVLPKSGKPVNILVIGAGGFTIGLEDAHNLYHFVDIDGSLKEIAERDFLQQKLGPNKIFHPVSAEAFLASGDETFDLIILDAYLGDLTIPEQLVTQDFFRRVKNRLGDNGIVAANFILSPSFANAYSRNIDNTFRSVFPFVTRQVIGHYNGWDAKTMDNTIYIYNRHADETKTKIYTDNKNTVYYDKPSRR